MEGKKNRICCFPWTLLLATLTCLTSAISSCNDANNCPKIVGLATVDGSVGFIRSYHVNSGKRNGSFDTVYLNHGFNKELYMKAFMERYNDQNEELYFDSFESFLTDSVSINLKDHCSFSDSSTIKYLLWWINIVYDTHFRGVFRDISKDSFASLYYKIGSQIRLNRDSIYLAKYYKTINKQLLICSQKLSLSGNNYVMLSQNSASYQTAIAVVQEKHLTLYIFRNLGYLMTDTFKI